MPRNEDSMKPQDKVWQVTWEDAGYHIGTYEVHPPMWDQVEDAVTHEITETMWGVQLNLAWLEICEQVRQSRK